LLSKSALAVWNWRILWLDYLSVYLSYYYVTICMVYKRFSNCCNPSVFWRYWLGNGRRIRPV